MKKRTAKLLSLSLLILAMVTSFLIWHPAHSRAAFVANDVMDDNIFDNSGTMSASQIDTFINSFPGSCISTNNGFSSADPTGYSATTGLFYYGSPVSAGQVIADAAQAYNLNPQVLIATIQKEEGIVRGDGPYGCSALALSASAGYGCTDSGTASHTYTYTNGSDAGTLPTPLYYINGSPVNSVTNTCVNTNLKAGFSEQIIHAAWLLAFGRHRSEGETSWAIIKGNWNNSDDPGTCYGGPMTPGNRKRCSTDPTAVPYDGYTTIDGQSILMSTGATAALYWYTPHLSGNTSFVNIFEGWFGPTKGSLVQAYGDKTVYLLTGTVAYPIFDVNILNDLNPLGPVRQTSASEINNYVLGPTANRLFKGSDGTVYLINSGIKLAFADCNMVNDYGYNCGNALLLSDGQLAKFVNGPPVTHLLKGVNNPTVYYIEAGQKRPIPSWNDVVAFKIPYLNWLSDAFVNQIPSSNAVAYGPGSLVKSPNDASVYAVKDSDNIMPVTSFIFSQELGLGSSPRTIISYYTVLNNRLNSMIQCSGNNYVGTLGTTYLIPSASIMTAYGFQQSNFVDGGATCLGLPISGQPLGQFIKSVTGAIFYVSGGQKQYITNYSAYQNRGGNASNTINVSNYFLNLLSDGQAITS